MGQSFWQANSLRALSCSFLPLSTQSFFLFSSLSSRLMKRVYSLFWRYSAAALRMSPLAECEPRRGLLWKLVEGLVHAGGAGEESEGGVSEAVQERHAAVGSGIYAIN